MSADQSSLPPAPREEYPIDYLGDDPFGAAQAGSKPAAKEKVPLTPGKAPGPTRPAKSSRASDFWALVGCNAIVFGASVCIMVLELTASRLIAKSIGQSLYTWTSVIGVVLAGISIGNYLGGWLADRYAPQKVLAWLFLTSGLLTFSVLFLNNWAAAADRPAEMSWQLWVMLVVAWIFFWPAVSLGAISPVTASMALARSAKTGITVGNIYAWGALGSIVGTFLTGFWLIGHFGSQQVIWMTSCALVLMGALVAAGQRVFRTVALVGALPLIVQFGIISSTTGDQMAAVCRGIAGIRSGWRTADADFGADREAQRLANENHDEARALAARDRNSWRWQRKRVEDDWADWGKRLGEQLQQVGRSLALRRDDPQVFTDESDYYTIKISDGRERGDKVKVLTLDHLIHSYWNPERPAKLYYDYELVYAAVTERAAALSGRLIEVALEDVPDGDEMVAAFPPSIKFDRQAKKLSTRGTMEFAQLRRMLSIGPCADFWQALFSTWEKAASDWDRASRQQGGIILTDLAALPEGVELPADGSARVHFDKVLNSLVCTGPFSLGELLDLMEQGAMEQYVGAVRELFNRSRHASTLFIGGGGFVFPRWVEQSFWYEPVIDVAEIDPAVQAAIEGQLGLPTEYGSPDDGKTYIRTHIGDARQFVDDQLRENKRRLAAGQPLANYDFIYGDAFNDLSVPWHLTTAEFSEKVAQLLTPGRGVYLVNIIDIYPRAQHAVKLEKFAAAAPREGPLNGIPESASSSDQPIDVWRPLGSPFEGLQLLRLEGGGHLLGYRGVMQVLRRDDLLKAAAGDAQIEEAVRALYKKSREEKVGQFLGRFVNTAAKVFPCVYVFTTTKGEPGSQRDTFIVACSLQKLDFENLSVSGNYWEHGPFASSERDADGTPRTSGEMPAILELARGNLLTDDFAPVDNLLAPVFVDRSAAED